MLMQRTPAGFEAPLPESATPGTVSAAPPEESAPNRRELSLLALYLATSSTHQDRIRVLRRELAHQVYRIPCGELSHLIVEFHMAA